LYASLFMAKYISTKYRDYRSLVVFGGVSMRYPHVKDLIKKVGFPCIVVEGEGEEKLKHIVERCLDSKPEMLQSAISNIEEQYKGMYWSLNSSNDTYEEASDNSQVSNLDELPMPNYDTFFDSLREVCADEETYKTYRNLSWIPVSGSRGCVYRCNYCGHPNCFSGFRNRDGKKIAAEVLSQVKRYELPNVYFTDYLCESWCDSYCDAIIDNNYHITSSMEVRAHHGERFWTKLALAKVEFLVIGVEALSTRLLNSMNKASKCIWNVMAKKYCTELGIPPITNLITHHPDSTERDIDETKRIIEMIPHFEPFRISRYYLVPGSTIYSRMSAEEIENLKPRDYLSYPEEVREYLIFASYDLPKRLRLSEKISGEWDKFVIWYDANKCDVSVGAPECSVKRISEDSFITKDTRFDLNCEYLLSGELAAVFDACHVARKFEDLTNVTGLESHTVSKQIKYLISRSLVVQADGYYLAIATRCRDELINNYYNT